MGHSGVTIIKTKTGGKIYWNYDVHCSSRASKNCRPPDTKEWGRGSLVVAHLPWTSWVRGSNSASGLCAWSLHVPIMLRRFPRGTPFYSPSPKTC